MANNIIPDEPIKISSVHIIGNEIIPAVKMLEIIKPTEFISEAVLNSQIQNLLTYYGNNGFPFTVIEPQDFFINDTAKTVSYTLKINEGPLVRIDDLQFSGSSVSDARIKQLVRFKPNLLYSENTRKKVFQNLESNNFSIADYRIIESDSTYIMQVDVKEKSNQTITGAVSYLPSFRHFNGFFYLELNNLFSTLRKTKLGWERYGQFTNFDLLYSDPYFLGFILSLNGIHNIIDTFYAKTSFNSDIGLVLTDNFSLNFFIGYDQTTANLLNISSFQTFWLGQGLTLKNNSNSRQVYKLDFNTSLGTRKQLSQTQIISKTHIESGVFFSIGKNTNYFNNIILKNLFSKSDLSISDSMYVGGTRTLRGYQENEFSTNRFLLIRNDFAFFRNRNTYAFLLGDFSWIHSYPDNLIKFGYGLGIKVKSRNTTVEISYAVPYPENLLKGKIHLRLSNSF